MSDDGVWKPFGAENDPTFDGLHDGVPAWLAQSFWDWIEQTFTVVSHQMYVADQFNVELLRTVERQLKVSVPYTETFLPEGVRKLRKAFTESGRELMLADFLLSVRAPNSNAGTLKNILVEGGSRWTIGTRSGKRGLVARVPEGVQLAAEGVMRSPGHAGPRLAEAWNAAFSIDPNPSHAYSLAVKAVEDATIPLMLPNNPNATLGNVLSHMKDTSWGLPFTREHGQYPVSQTLIGQMQMLWSGQTDRHGGADGPSVAVSQQAAEAAVMFAVPIIWAFTSGAASKR
jgi:hypothetical protein